MKSSEFKAGERVTYVEIIHATVMNASANGVTITYQGRGKLLGEKVITRVASKWLEKGWNPLKEPGK